MLTILLACLFATATNAQCTCEHGLAADGAACPFDGAAWCASCTSPNVLDANTGSCDLPPCTQDKYRTSTGSCQPWSYFEPAPWSKCTGSTFISTKPEPAAGTDLVCSPCQYRRDQYCAHGQYQMNPCDGSQEGKISFLLIHIYLTWMFWLCLSYSYSYSYFYSFKIYFYFNFFFVLFFSTFLILKLNTVDTSKCMWCTAESQSCNSGQYITGTVQSRSSTRCAGDVDCANCKTTCTNGFFLSGSCTGSKTTDTTKCTAWKVCPQDTYELTSPSATQDRVCAPIPCSTNQYKSYKYGVIKEQNRECKSCVSSCPFGKFLHNACDGSGTTDTTECKSCDAKCNQGQHITARSCGGDTNSNSVTCQDCTTSCPTGHTLIGDTCDGSDMNEPPTCVSWSPPCSGNTYESVTPTLIVDRVCSNCLLTNRCENGACHD